MEKRTIAWVNGAQIIEYQEDDSLRYLVKRGQSYIGNGPISGGFPSKKAAIKKARKGGA